MEVTDMDDKETITSHEIIQGIIGRFKRGDIDLPVMGKVIQEIQKVMSRTSATVNELASVIERDAVILVRLISVANSPVYRGAEKILAVRQAIPRLGLNETQNIVATIANKSLYEVKDLYFKNTMENFWLHSLAAAYIARAIASKLMLGGIDKIYFMGLTHDIGKVLLLKTFGDIYSKNKLWDVKEITADIQKVHTSFGAAILRKWGFSEEFARISLLHEGPEFRPETDKEILAVNLASNVADKLGYGQAEDEEVELQSLASARLLNIDSGIIDDLCEKAKELMQETSNIF
jgi:putative nucleotidyltransferase with HDIG domain